MLSFLFKNDISIYIYPANQLTSLQIKYFLNRKPRFYFCFLVHAMQYNAHTSNSRSLLDPIIYMHTERTFAFDLI